MSIYDQWQIAGVLPEDYTEFDDWVFHIVDSVTVDSIVYHKHTEYSDSGGRSIVLYMTNNNKCRDCGAQAPPGVLFLARTYKIEKAL